MDRILIVEDTDIGREVLSFSLEERFECDVAANGAEAMEFLKKNSYACVLLDIVMPVVDGFGVLQFMKEFFAGGNAAKKPPVVVLTSSNEDDVREKCLAAGASEFLNKPFKLKEINAALANVGVQG